MAQQKLYTEEQLTRYLLDEGIMELSDLANNLIPHIKLPSDENIEEKAEFLFPTVNRMGGPTYIAHKSFIEGAKWMKEQILNQTK